MCESESERERREGPESRPRAMLGRGRVGEGGAGPAKRPRDGILETLRVSSLADARADFCASTDWPYSRPLLSLFLLATPSLPWQSFQNRPGQTTKALTAVDAVDCWPGEAASSWCNETPTRRTSTDPDRRLIRHQACELSEHSSLVPRRWLGGPHLQRRTGNTSSGMASAVCLAKDRASRRLRLCWPRPSPRVLARPDAESDAELTPKLMAKPVLMPALMLTSALASDADV